MEITERRGEERRGEERSSTVWHEDFLDLQIFSVFLPGSTTNPTEKLLAIPFQVLVVAKL
jgi:hypothetical protein